MGTRGKIIIVPDVHQNFRFLEKILDSQNLDEAGKLLFLGDFFDAKDGFFGPIAALEKTLQMMIELIKLHPGKVMLLLGNHDVLYFYNNREGSGINLQSRNELQNYYGIPDRQKMTLLRSMDLSEFWKLFQLSHYEQGFLFSHAGITLDYWSKRLSVQDNVDNLNFSMGSLLNDRGELNTLFRAGFSRGGDLEKGGPLWLDWSREFSEEIGIPQIVGHTVGSDYRKTGNSFCLDAQQQCFGVLEGGNLEIHRV